MAISVKEAVRRALAERPKSLIAASGKAKGHMLRSMPEGKRSLTSIPKAKHKEIWAEVKRQAGSYLKTSSKKKKSGKKTKTSSRKKNTATAKATSERKMNKMKTMARAAKKSTKPKARKKNAPAKGLVSQMGNELTAMLFPTAIGALGYMGPGLISAGLHDQMQKVDWFKKNPKYAPVVVSGLALGAGTGIAVWQKTNATVKKYAGPLLVGMGIRFAMDLANAVMPTTAGFWSSARLAAGLSPTAIPPTSPPQTAPGTAPGTAPAPPNSIQVRWDKSTDYFLAADSSRVSQEDLTTQTDMTLKLTETGQLLVDPSNIPWKISADGGVDLSGHAANAFAVAGQDIGLTPEQQLEQQRQIEQQAQMQKQMEAAQEESLAFQNVSGYGMWRPAMSGYASWRPALGRGPSPGYQLGAGPAAGYQLSGAPAVGYQLGRGPSPGYQLSGKTAWRGNWGKNW